MKLSEATDIFLAAVKAENLSQETVKWYRKRLSRLVAFFSDCELCEVSSTDHLRRFVVSLQEQDLKYEKHRYHKPIPGHLSPATIHSYVRCIKRLFNWLEDEKIITLNIAYRLKKPEMPKQPPKEIAESDLLALLNASKVWGKHRARNYAMILFLAETGVRVAGLVNLRLGDVDLKRGQAVVTEKGNKSRVVFFGKETRKALSAWLAERSDDAEYLFVGDCGRLTAYGVRMTLRHLKRFAGIEGRVNPHSFRHFFAKRMIMQGGDVSLLSALMGHSDIKVTRDAYLIFKTDELQGAHNRFASLDGSLRH